MVNFFDWLDEELDQRGWVRADLAKRAGISESGLSMAYSGKRKPGLDMLKAIAHALKLPAETVFQAAGILPPSRDDDLSPIKRTVLHMLKGLPDSDAEMVAALLEQRTEYYKQHPEAKPAK